MDEKLTLRILKSSDSKKTILINRGLEDGLVVDDHAKFFTTKGVVARGIVIKSSPSRSVWSLYRIIDPTMILPDAVLKLKISSPVKLTPDGTKMLVPKITLDPSINNINGATQYERFSYEEARDIENLRDTPTVRYNNSTITTNYKSKRSILTHADWEIFIKTFFNGFSITYSVNGEETRGDSSAMNLILGAEKYFKTNKFFMRDISLSFFIQTGSEESVYPIYGPTEESSFTYGGGISYHFFHNPRAVRELMAYSTFNLGVGVVENKSLKHDGSSSFFSFGAGFKYYLTTGLGFRALIDYYHKNDEYIVEDPEPNYGKTVSGPRAQVGLSYRF